MTSKTFAMMLVALAATSVAAQDQSVGVTDQLGLGVILGEPTGFSVKYWLDKEHAIDGAAAWSFWDDDGFQIHGDYLWHNYDLLDIDEVSGELPVYYGVGARLKFTEDEGKHDDHDTVFGIRVPLGISYMFGGSPVEAFGEIVPVLDLSPDVELNLNLAVGLRFYID